MHTPSHKEVQAMLEAVQKAAQKKEQLLQANKAAARALLSSISTVSYVTTKKNESTE